MPSSTVKKLGASLKSFIGIKRGRVRVKCPATSANLGAGFDICGVALQEPFDVMTVSLSKNSGCTVSTAEKSRYSVPSDFACNTCGPVYEKMRAEFGLSPSVDVVIEKNIKPGSGLGSSAASASLKSNWFYSPRSAKPFPPVRLTSTMFLPPSWAALPLPTLMTLSASCAFPLLPTSRPS